MPELRIIAGPFTFGVRFEESAAPATCAKFRALLPYSERIIHVRWSGEACWIPLGDLDLELGFENAPSYPAPGEIVLFPGRFSERVCMAQGAPNGARAISADLGGVALRWTCRGWAREETLCAL